MTRPERNLVRQAVIFLSAAAFYPLDILLLDETVLGIQIGFTEIVFLALIVSAVVYLGIRWTTGRQWISPKRLQRAGLVAVISVFSILVIDIVYSLHFNATVPRQRVDILRFIDPHHLIAEVFPVLYYPTEKNFRIHKPDQLMQTEHYGAFYSPELMKSRTLADSVFQLKRLRISIDEHGFRETTPMSQAEIFSLGDSFAFGWGVEDGRTWVDLLERAIGEPIYNLGVHDASPLQELLILQYVLENQVDARNIRHLLWMIFEGNDLEDSYDTHRPGYLQNRVTLGDLFEGTLVARIREIPYAIKRESIIDRFRTGRIKFSFSLDRSNRRDPFEVDGVKLVIPLYRSPRFGYMLFYSLYMERAAQPRSYVMKHPNRPRLDQVFRDMASMSARYGFRVTVIIIPTPNRLYAPYFDGFPAISPEPHFIDYVADLSREMGFDTIDLYDSFRPYAGRELLYFRDDDHWNERGNEVVAELIASNFRN